MNLKYLAMASSLALAGCGAVESTVEGAADLASAGVEGATDLASAGVEGATDLASSGFDSVASLVETGVVDENCNVLIPADELTFDEANIVYACIAEDLVAGYKTGEKRWVSADSVNNYRSWVPASTKPANPGFHSERYLYTYVNETGAAEYLKYADERGPMPVGTVLAKESFAVGDDGKVVKGPLFLMEKAEAGASPKTGDWFYTMVSAKGTPLGINVFRACHDCHSGFEDSDFMGYPVEEARVGG